MDESKLVEHPDIPTTRTGYDDVAELYADMFADALAAQPFDRAILGAFADRVRAAGAGPVLDVGCGPGRITTYLDSLGLDVSGIDLSPEMIRLARADRPDLRYEIGTMEQLPLDDAAVAGLLSWYSIIHLPPERVPGVLAEFARVLRPGGQLVMGFQAADDESVEVQPYDHRVTTSYRWSARAMTELLRPHRFSVIARMHREPDPDERTPHWYLIATRE
ncbi:class I SAM-dependent methyltransferase [Nocardia macrotermitis]|uniref:Ubiquinone/menaquinone biosynthesis C-methyltransferase UbiE n=1 Tax=Nocardia macrotermitis TaxID=2585198 RepID=A0A7K0DE40_9NOCA|nr:class I SAM-dependent methyltransferase [Nocardia macrotermitis]MQY23977.1 Ubiquinone/menaquinone biosynthesis C-methyltransferase UbiE [Nocardia macrotermitis]